METLIREEPDLEMIAAMSNAETVEADIRELKPDVVLMDIDMPAVNGVSAVKRIRQCSFASAATASTNIAPARPICSRKLIVSVPCPSALQTAQGRSPKLPAPRRSRHKNLRSRLRLNVQRSGIDTGRKLRQSAATQVDVERHYVGTVGSTIGVGDGNVCQLQSAVSATESNRVGQSR